MGMKRERFEATLRFRSAHLWYMGVALALQPKVITPLVGVK